MGRIFLCFTVFSLFAACALGESILDSPYASDAVKTNYVRSVNLFQERKSVHGACSDYFIVPGLIADKTRREVVLDSFSTLVKKGDIAEFYVISSNSGHDYESLFVTFASPGDVARAMEFIGMPRGISVNPGKFRFWSKGERACLFVRGHDGKETPIEFFVMDAQTGKALSQEGFVFLGDKWDETGEKFLPDTTGPGSIAPSYNEALSVFDTPRLAMQSDVYEKFLVGKPGASVTNSFVEIVIRPEDRKGFPEKRVRDFTLRIGNGFFELEGCSSRTNLSEVMTILGNALKERQDPYVSVVWDEDVSLSHLAAVCGILEGPDSSGMIKIEPPAPGLPYFKAFLPNKDWRNRERRFAQPCELVISKGGSEASLNVIKEIWKDDSSIRPELEVKRIDGVTPDNLSELLAKNGPERLPVLLVFADPSDTYSSIAAYVKSAMKTHGNLYIFLGGVEAGSDAASARKQNEAEHGAGGDADGQ